MKTSHHQAVSGIHESFSYGYTSTRYKEVRCVRQAVCFGSPLAANFQFSLSEPPSQICRASMCCWLCPSLFFMPMGYFLREELRSACVSERVALTTRDSSDGRRGFCVPGMKGLQGRVNPPAPPPRSARNAQRHAYHIVLRVCLRVHLSVGLYKQTGLQRQTFVGAMMQ